MVPQTVIFLQEDAAASKNCMSVHDPHWRFEVGVGAAVSIWVAEHVVNGVHMRSEVREAAMLSYCAGVQVVNRPHSRFEKRVGAALS